MELQTKANSVMSDEKIVDLYWQRDEQAIKETDIKYKKFLLSVAMNIVHDMCDSEECLNDTYNGAWNSMPPARPILLQSFLSTIMRRTAINRFTWIFLSALLIGISVTILKIRDRFNKARF